MGKRRPARQSHRPAKHRRAAAPAESHADSAPDRFTPADAAHGTALLNDAAVELEGLHLQAKDAAGLQRLIGDLRAYQEQAGQQQEQLIEVQKYLEDSRDRFADLYDFAPIGYVTFDPWGVIEEINLTATLLLGVERERLIGMPMLPYVVKEDAKAFLAHMIRCRAGELRVTTELQLKPRAAVAVHVHLSSRPGPLTPNGRQTYRTALVDVTELKQRDAELEEYRQRLRSLTSELALTEERERRRIATALHDNLGQILALARIKLGGLTKLLTPDLVHDGPAAKAMAEVQKLVIDAVQQTRSLTLELSPPVLSLGLDAAMEWLVEQNRQHGLSVEFRQLSLSPAMAEEVKILLFQAVRELLNNVVKHAGASHATVTLRTRGQQLEVTVEDDGVGMLQAPDDPHLMRGDGFGLFSLRTRLEHLGGLLRIDSPADTRHGGGRRGKGGGTRMTVCVPTEPGKSPQCNPAGGAVHRAAAGDGEMKATAAEPQTDVTTHPRPGARHSTQAGAGPTGGNSDAKRPNEDPAGRRPPDRPRRPAKPASGRA